MEAIADQLRLISIEGGYLTDAGTRVYHWRDPMGEPWQKEEKPACFIRDASSEIQAQDSSVHEHALSIEVGAVVDGFDASAVMRDLESDIFKAIGTDPTFSGLCHYCQPTGTQSEFKATGDNNAVVRITLEVRYRTPAWDALTLHAAPE